MYDLPPTPINNLGIGVIYARVVSPVRKALQVWPCTPTILNPTICYKQWQTLYKHLYLQVPVEYSMPVVRCECECSLLWSHPWFTYMTTAYSVYFHLNYGCNFNMDMQLQPLSECWYFLKHFAKFWSITDLPHMKCSLTKNKQTSEVLVEEWSEIQPLDHFSVL